MPDDQQPPTGEFLLYQTEDGRSRIECRLRDETLWLSLNQISELFDRDKSVISKHLKNIFEEGELVRDSVVAQNATTAADGKTYQVDYYRLEAVLAVGYRVRSSRGTQFRQWATDHRPPIPDPRSPPTGHRSASLTIAWGEAIYATQRFFFPSPRPSFCLNPCHCTNFHFSSVTEPITASNDEFGNFLRN